MTIDLSEFRAHRASQPCTVGRFAAKLDATNRDKFTAALAEGTISTMAIYRWLIEKGAPFQYNVVHRHRTNQCACNRT